jgi:ribosomal protein S18 acetylase RimI-like enzyme
MKKLTFITSFCFIFTLGAMEKQSNELFIGMAEEKHIPALTALSDEVIEEFFKPVMYKEYTDYPEGSLETWFNACDSFFEDFFKKATSNIENNNDYILIASTNKESDTLLGLCACTKEEQSIFINYLIVSQHLRGKGIGKALVHKALSTYGDISSCKLVTLARGNEAAHAFYEKFGFTSTKELCDAHESMPKTHFMYQLDIKK